MYVKELNTSHFTSLPKQFGARHFPKNPMQQFCNKPISWNEYLEKDGPEIYGEFYDKGFSQELIQPSSRMIYPGERIKFVFKSKCQHFSIPPHEQYVLLLVVDGSTRIPFEEESGKIWICETMINPGTRNIAVHYVDTLDNSNAKGIGVQKYKSSVGRTGMSFKGLCRWDVAS
jgi:hypothetical protein